MTITLHDLHCILRLPIDGRSCTTTMSETAIRERIAQDLQVSLAQVGSWYRGGGIPTAYLEGRLRVMMESAERDKSFIASYYMFLLLGSTVLVDKSTTKLKHKWMALLFDHETTGGYAWGAGILAYVYRNLGQASRQGTQGIASWGILIRSWLWAYFPHFYGHYIMNPLYMSDSRATARYGGSVPGSKDLSRLVSIRRILDSVRFEEVDWLPFRGLDFDSPEIAPSRFCGILRMLEISEPYMPDCVLRQFGLAQGIPEHPIQPTFVERQNEFRNYTIQFSDDLLEQWDADPRPLIELQGPHATRFWDISDDYLDFLDEYSHVMIDPRSVRRDRSVGVVHTMRVADTLARIHLLAGELRSLLEMPEDRRDIVTMQTLSRWLEILIGETPPMAPSPPRASRLFGESVHEHGEGSRSQHETTVPVDTTSHVDTTGTGGPSTVVSTPPLARDDSAI